MKENKRRIYYVFNGRFPSEKAHALYVTKHCEAFHNEGFQATVIAPKRINNSTSSYPEYFGVEKSFEAIYLPTLDLYSLPISKKIPFYLNNFVFSIGVFFHFLFKPASNTVIFSNDALSCVILTLQGKRVVYEMHDYPENFALFYALLFKFVFKILTQNEWKKKKLSSQFNIDPEKIIVEPNAVDLHKFDIKISKDEARTSLSLPADRFIAVYTGHLFDWKGADVLAESARYLDESFLIVFVGGNKKDVERFTIAYGDAANIQIVGHKPHGEVPLWQKAADCLILPNTGKMDISKYYTSPMKLFEYMASGVPIIASDLPSVREVASEAAVTFFTPDNPNALADTIMNVQRNPMLFEEKAQLARNGITKHTWEQRAKRLLSLCLT